MKAITNLAKTIKAVKDELNRTRLFLDLLTCVQDSGFSIEALAKESGVAPATLYFWLDGKTKHPRIDTVHKVATALGLDIRLYRMHKVTPKPEQRRVRVVK
jgi:DNA-binding phage protein